MLRAQITRRTKCRCGFYLLIGPNRHWFKRKRDALKELARLLRKLKIGIVTVNDYAKQTRTPMPDLREPQC